MTSGRSAERRQDAAAVVTGYAAVPPLGDTDATWEAVLAGRSAARSWPDLDELPVPVACRVAHVPAGDPRHRGRDLAGRAVGQAVAHAGIDLQSFDPARVGVFVGTTMGESAAYELAVDDGDASAFDVDGAAGQVFGRHVAELVGSRGPVRVFGTACAAGNYAIGAAADAVRSGAVDVAIAGGVEPFSRIAAVGFARMRAMTPDLCRPFVAGRRGMQLGEGAAFVIVERADEAQRRGATTRARVGTLGLASDAYHPTSPRPDGSGMASAMAGALRRSGIEAPGIGWVSAHGTGTLQSDAAEALALGTVFGAGGVPVSSVKGAIGHAMGAAAAIEAVLSVRALETGVVPPNVNGEAPDPALRLDVVTTARGAGPRAVLSCAYAFGGLCSALPFEVPARSAA